MSYRLRITTALLIAVGLVLGLAPGFNAVMAQDVNIQSVTQITVQSPSYRPPEVDQLFRDMGLGQEFVFTQAEDNLWHLTNANSSSRLADCRELARDQQSITWLCGALHINANLPTKRVTANNYQHLIGTVTDATKTLPVAPIAKGVVRQGGQPVVNATVKQKATSQQTTTDAGGQYELEVTGEAALLVVSYPGTAPHEVAVNTGTLSDNVYTLDVTLEESVTRIVVEAPSSRAPAADQFLREMNLGRQYVFTMTEESTWQLTNTGSTSLLAICREIIRTEQGIDLSCGSRIMQVNLSTKQVLANRQYVIGTVSEVGQSGFLAATTRVKGVVRQTSTGKPVTEATVSEKGQSRTVSTDALGQYELEVTHADAMLVVSFPGAQETEQAVSAGAVADNVYTVDISLGCLQGTDWYAGNGHGCLVPGAPLPVRGGVMQDKSRKFIPAATVTEKGTSNTATTDAAGQYAIDVSNANAVLVFTYPGAASQEIGLSDQRLVGAHFVIDAPMACAANHLWMGDSCTLPPPLVVTVVFTEPDDGTAPPPEPLPIPEQADPNVIVIAPANVEPYAVLREDYLASPQSFTQGGNWMGLTPDVLGSVSVPPAVRPGFENDATAAWLSVPGLYGNSNTNEVFRPFVESAFAAMREADWDVRGAGTVDEFLLKLKADEDLRADFTPFLVVAAYEGLVSEEVSDPARARANAYIREVIGGRVVGWQKYINQDIRYQWADWKNTIQDNYLQSYPQYATLSTLVNLPSGCGNFQVEPPAPLVVSGGAAGLNAVKSIFGPAGMIAAAEYASILESEVGTEWANTPMGRFEANTGIAVENLNEALAARAAMTQIGLGGAAVGVLAATTGGIERYRLEKIKKFTATASENIKANDVADIRRAHDQLKINSAGDAAREQAEKLGLKPSEVDDAVRKAEQKARQEIAEKAAQEAAEKAAQEAGEAVGEKALKEAVDELSEEVFESGGKKLSSKIAARFGTKFGTRLTNILGASLGVVGVIATFGEILYETLPCEAFESGVLGNLHEVQPDFRAALVTSGEYQDGLLYNYCRPGYSGVATNCVKDGCPYGYAESLLYCTPKVTAKDSYGRGVGRSGICEPGEENIAGLCYAACPSGSTGVGPVCWSNCPAGYNDTGAFCSRGGQVVSQETYTRADQASPMVCSSNQTMEDGLCYQTCREGFSGVVTDCVQTACPEGYNNHIATCYRPSPPHSITKERYGRGAGTVPGSCPQGSERKGALCYPNCASGYLSNALNCDQPCPAGYVDDGLTCRMPIETIAKTSSGRGASVPLACSDPAFPSSFGLLCYPECREGYTGNGPVCWEDCPATMVDTGALCQFIPEENPVGFAKESYGRGVGTVPQALGTDVDKDGLLDNLDPHFYDRVDAQIGGISANARQQLLEETFVHLVSYFIAEPAAQGKLNIPPIEID